MDTGGQVEKVITEATRPPKPRTRWSVRTMAREVGISPDSVQRIWRANDIRPHLVRTFKVSNDKYFEQKFWDVIGLYPGSARAGPCIVLRRKEPMPGFGADPAGLTSWRGRDLHQDT